MAVDAMVLKRRALGVLGLLFVAGTFMVGCREAPPPPAMQGVPVVAVVLTATTATNYFENIGETIGSQTVEIRARVPGFLEKVLFTEGNPVKEGDLLYLIDDRPLRAALEQAQGALAQATANWEKAKRDTNRLGPLLEKRAISRQQYDDAAAMEQTSAAILRSSEAAVTNAILQLDYTVIKSPVDGIIGKTEVNPGNLVGQGQPTLLTTISTVDPIHVRFSVNEQRYLQWMRERPATRRSDGIFQLVLSDGSMHPELGSFVFGDREIDTRTGTFLLQVSFRNPNSILRPGQFARVRLPMEVYTNAVLVPQKAVQELQATYSVYLVSPENKAELRRLELGPRIGTDYLVRSGVQPGEKLVVDGLQKLQPGAPLLVTVTNLARGNAE